MTSTQPNEFKSPYMQIVSELSLQEANNRIINDMKNESNSKLPPGWLDWNTLSLDQMANYLEQKYKFNSSGDVLCIYKLVEFYKEHKPSGYYEYIEQYYSEE